MTVEQFVDIVVGAGQAGPSLAARLAGAGRKVALVERRFYGGTCINTGCRPTKTLIASAKVAEMARRAAEFGIVAGPVSADMKAVHARVAAIVAKGRQELADWLAGVNGLTLVHGHARLTGPNSVDVAGQVFEAERIFVNVGARAVLPDLPGVRNVPTLDNTGMLALEELPRHLVVVGGGYIGLEFAQAFRRLGSEVTVVEKGPQVIGREDPDVSEAVRRILEDEGVRIRTHAECIRFARYDGRVAVHVDCAEGAPEEFGTHVLLAMGRKPNTNDLGLDAAGVETDKRGIIPVDDRLATNVAGIWALGECNGRGAFTHTAYNDYEVLAANLLDGGDRKVTDRPPACLRPLHRPAPRPGRHVRGRGPRVRPPGPRRHPADGDGQPRRREERDRWLHQGARRRRHPGDPRSRDPRGRGRRGDPRRSRPHVCRRPRRGHRPRGPHPPDRR